MNIAAPKITKNIDETVATSDHRSPDASGFAAVLPRDDFDRNVWCLMGLPIDCLDVGAAADAVTASARDGKRLSFVTPNVNILVAGRKDRSLRAKILNGDLCLADGAPIVKMAKMIGAPISHRCAGSDVFNALRQRPGFPGRQLKVFFFGGRDGAAAAAHDALIAENGGLVSVGHYNPGFGDIESMSSAEIIAEINAVKPDFIVVALGFAKGQAWIERNKNLLSAPAIAHLGAVVDFAAGSIKRSPKWITDLGAEWLWRIAQEPTLWRRYVKDGAELIGILPRMLRQSRAFAVGRKKSFSEPSVEIEQSARSMVIKLSGCFRENNLLPLREAFRNAVKQLKNVTEPRDLILDFTNVKSADGAFWGMVLMLEKNLLSTNCEIVVAGASRVMREIVAINDLPYALIDQVPLNFEKADELFAEAI